MHVAMIRLSATPLVDAHSSGVFGGAEVRAWTFAAGLAAQARHRVSFVVADRRPSSSVYRGVTLVRVVGRRRVGRRSTGWVRSSGALAGRWIRSVQQRMSAVPLVHAEIARISADSYATFGLQHPTPEIVRTARALGRPVVVFLTSDDDTRDALVDGPVLNSRRRRRRRAHRYAIEQADCVIAQTRYQRRLVEGCGRDAELVRNPIDVRIDVDPPTPLTDRHYALWVGRADTDCKRADLCLRVARECPQVPFLMIMNPTDPQTTQTLKSSAPPNVRFLDRIDWDVSDEVYKDALLLLNTSESEGFPNALLQAAKYGVPICSRRVNPDGVLTRHGIGFLAHDSLTHLAAMVRRIHRDRARFAAVSQAARHYVCTYHALEQQVAQLSDIFARLETARHSAAA